MKRTIIFFLALLLYDQSNASEWKEIGRYSGARLLIDVSSISQTGNYKKAWFKMIFDEDQYDEPNQEKKVWKVSKTLGYFLCQERLAGIGQIIHYPITEDTPTQSLFHKLGQVEFVEVAPDTLGEAELEYACKPNKK